MVGKPVPQLGFSLLLSTLALASFAVGEEQERRIIPVSIVDDEGRVVHGLTADNFRAEFQGRSISLLSATEDTAARRMAIVVDTSGGMSGAKWVAAWLSAERLVRALTPNHRVALLTLAETVEQHIGFTHSQELLLEHVARLKRQSPYGKSGLDEGILGVVRAWPDPTLGDSLCLISDGLDTISRSSPQEAQAALVNAGLPASVLWVRSSAVTRAGANRKWAEELAESTGGITVTIEHPNYKAAEWDALLQPLVEATTHLYLLEVGLPRPIEEPLDWKLTVVDQQGRERKDITVAYPRLLFRRGERLED
jgi:Mg-chelatase subunit ChlD